MSDINRNKVGKHIKKLTIEAESYDSDIQRLETEIAEIKIKKQDKLDIIDLISSILTKNEIQVKDLLKEDILPVENIV